MGICLLLLWGMAADFAGRRNNVLFRHEFLTTALHVAGDELSRTPFPITPKTTVTLRPHHLCAGTAKDWLCYAFRVTTPGGPRSPAVKEHFTIAVDTVSGEAVVVPNAAK